MVHGRHSSENILVTEPLTFQVIDFSHAQIFEKFAPRGFERDVARIGARLTIEYACTREDILRIFTEVARAAPAGLVDVGRLGAEFEKALKNSK